MKPILTLVLSLISTLAWAIDKDRGGGAEIEELFSQSVAAFFMYAENSKLPKEDLEAMKVAWGQLKDIEATMVLKHSDGTPVENQEVHYAWYENGILQLKQDWWDKKFANFDTSLVPTAHELFRIAEHFTGDSKRFNDDKYLLSLHKYDFSSLHGLVDDLLLGHESADKIGMYSAFESSRDILVPANSSGFFNRISHRIWCFWDVGEYKPYNRVLSRNRQLIIGAPEVQYDKARRAPGVYHTYYNQVVFPILGSRIKSLTIVMTHRNASGFPNIWSLPSINDLQQCLDGTFAIKFKQPEEL